MEACDEWANRNTDIDAARILPMGTPFVGVWTCEGEDADRQPTLKNTPIPELPGISI
jgi:hypothetical protein